MATKKSQVQKFREAAKEAGADNSEARFNATLKDLAKSPREAGQKEMPPSADAKEAGASSHQKPKSS
jgi:hypothetical protein